MIVATHPILDLLVLTSPGVREHILIMIGLESALRRISAAVFILSVAVFGEFHRLYARLAEFPSIILLLSADFVKDLILLQILICLLARQSRYV